MRKTSTLKFRGCPRLSNLKPPLKLLKVRFGGLESRNFSSGQNGRNLKKFSKKSKSNRNYSKKRENRKQRKQKEIAFYMRASHSRRRVFREETAHVRPENRRNYRFTNVKRAKK